jgi:hypothetical protein
VELKIHLQTETASLWMSTQRCHWFPGLLRLSDYFLVQAQRLLPQVEHSAQVLEERSLLQYKRVRIS